MSTEQNGDQTGKAKTDTQWETLAMQYIPFLFDFKMQFCYETDPLYSSFFFNTVPKNTVNECTIEHFDPKVFATVLQLSHTHLYS